MKLVTFLPEPQQSVLHNPALDLREAEIGFLLEAGVLPMEALGLPYGSWNDYLTDEERPALATLQQAVDRVLEENPAAVLARESVRLLAPIPQPLQDVLCIGKNYFPPELPQSERVAPPKTMYFGKRAWRIAGPDEILSAHEDLEPGYLYETELALVLGKPLFRATREEALEAIFAYSICNDCTAPVLCDKFVQAYVGKSLTGFTVLGPALVTADEFAHQPGEAPGFEIETWQNGELRQKGHTRDMIHGIPEMLVELSHHLYLAPGTIVSTGTPADLPDPQKRAKSLHAGDELRCVISGLGELRSFVAAESEAGK